MPKNARWLVTVLVSAVLAVPASCSGGSSGLAKADQAQIYAAVIRQLRHDQRAQMPAYIMEYTDGNGPGMVPAEPDRNILPESLRKAVLVALGGTPGDYTWVSDFSKVPHDAVFSGAACQIILGSTKRRDDGSVRVQGSLFYGGTGGGGGTFVVKKESGVWTVTGMTGPIWTS